MATIEDSDTASSTIRGISLEATNLSLQILKNLPENESKNAAFSPVSIYSLLAVLHQGSRGTSRSELHQVLQSGAKPTGEAVKSLTSNVEESDSSPSLKFEWKSRKKRDSKLTPQQGQCQDEEGLASRPGVPYRTSSETFAVLANMLSLNGFWAQEGLLKGDMDFYPSPEQQIRTESIEMKKSCFCGTSDEIGAKWIHIPIAVQKKREDTGQCAGVRPSCKSYWSRRKISLMVMLPTERHGLDKLIQDLTPDFLIKCFDYVPKEHRQNLELILPAFQIASCIDFKPIFKKLGLKSVFGNRSELCDVSVDGKLFLPSIKQKGQIVVDQFGARTTQETETNFPSLYCEPWEDTEPCSVDEPFLFFVVDKETLVPLIAGKVIKPEPSTWEPFDDDNEVDDFSQCQQQY